METAAVSNGLVMRMRGAVREIASAPGFGGLLACSLVLGLASSFVLPFLSLWGTQAVGMKPLTFALFMTSNAVCAMAASTFLARLSDTRWSRRTVLLIGGSGGTLGYLGYAFVMQPALLMLIGATLVSVSAISFSQIFAHARDELARSERGNAAFALGVLRASFSLAWTVGPALGALVLSHFGYRGSFLTASGLLLAYLSLVFGLVPARPRDTPAAASAVQREPLGRLLTRPFLLGQFVSFVLIFCAISMNLMNLPLLITQELGGGAPQVGTAFAVAPVFEIPFMLWLGRLSSSARQALMIRVGVLVGVAYFLALGFARGPVDVYPAQVLNAFTIAVTMSLAIPYFQDLLPGQTGLATSLYSSSWSLGSLMGYLSFGLLVEQLGHRGLTQLCAGLAVGSLLVLVSSRRPVPVTEPALAAELSARS
ncbi:MAG TPA: sugar efflux transporter [Polyangiaceae bacterium]|nr:sugar efflux transporter [Polyangiaceae bacterium]